MAATDTVETQPQRAEAGMVASAEAQQDNAIAIEQQEAMKEGETKKPKLQMRGGGLILDLCACFICCEICQGCCEAIDDCCCC